MFLSGGFCLIGFWRVFEDAGADFLAEVVFALESEPRADASAIGLWFLDVALFCAIPRSHPRKYYFP